MPIVSVNGTKIHYHATGRGVPLLCIHPPLLNQEIFNYQRAQLADDYKVVTFDIRGHGHSPYSEDPVSFALITEDMKQLMDTLGLDQAILIGYSTGGSVALEAMLTYPDRFIGGCLLSAMSEAKGALLRTQLALASGLSSLGAKRLLSSAIGWGNADMSYTFANLYKGAVLGDIRNIRQYFSAGMNVNLTDQLRAIKQPTLLMYGNENYTMHKAAHILRQGLPNNRLHVLHGVGHQIPTKAPRTMHRILTKWIEEVFVDKEQSSRVDAYLAGEPERWPESTRPGPVLLNQ